MKTLIKKNKGLFILPLLALPFVVLIFYILGGGQGQASIKSANKTFNGANYQLPDANRNIKIMDKKEAYQQMETVETPTIVELNVDTTISDATIQQVKNLDKQGATEVLMERIKIQEERSRQALNEAQGSVSHESQNAQNISDAKRISGQRPPKAKQKRHARSQPIELEELQDLLSEHEQLIRQKDSMQMQLQEKQMVLNQYEKLHRRKQKGFEVKIKTTSGFNKNSNAHQSLKAQIVEDSKVMTGNRIMLRLLNDTEINGQQIKANTLVYGLCKTDNERLQIYISSIPKRDNFLAVKLSVYDMDGIKGLYVPDNVARKVYQDVAGDINPSVLLTPTDDPMAYMGINAANDLSKNMMKRVRLKKVNLRKNTVVILQND
ncbi:conjugative transposon protein TraM [Carboxylicivirga sp. N1Y90]|uniref:conjugative transposon protein TraM n=1 Tax=Carboxylicivirga fragile TaxID=3417571 RepID=UPI003D32F54A|nr:conjugative transposon protein TraM [Marinilabiliaceae bacterium N1Y90]